MTLIATSFAGVFVSAEAWEETHTLWFEDAAEKLHDKGILKYVGMQDYWAGVQEVMERLHPDSTEEQRTKLSRESYFEAVLKYIQEHPDTIRKDVVDLFLELGKTHKIALVTTNTLDAISKLLAITHTENVFNIIEATRTQEKDDKNAVYHRFVERHGQPDIFVGRKCPLELDSAKWIQVCFDGEEELSKRVARTTAELSSLLQAQN